MGESVYIRFDFEVRVDLPEGTKCKRSDESQPTDKCRERAIEAALGALPQSIDVYIDGEEREPARVWIECSDSDVTETWVE